MGSATCGSPFDLAITPLAWGGRPRWEVRKLRSILNS